MDAQAPEMATGLMDARTGMVDADIDKKLSVFFSRSRCFKGLLRAVCLMFLLCSICFSALQIPGLQGWMYLSASTAIMATYWISDWVLKGLQKDWISSATKARTRKPTASFRSRWLSQPSRSS